jgi:hypothetical protein
MWAHRRLLLIGDFSEMRWSSTALALLLMIGHAVAGEPAMTALSCDETFTDAVGEEHLGKVGLIINLAEHIVTFDGMVAHIRNVTATDISFDETTIYETGGSFRVTGRLDRVTGAGWVYTIVQAKGSKGLETNHKMVCTKVAPLF